MIAVASSSTSQSATNASPSCANPSSGRFLDFLESSGPDAGKSAPTKSANKPSVQRQDNSSSPARKQQKQLLTTTVVTASDSQPLNLQGTSDLQFQQQATQSSQTGSESLARSVSKVSQDASSAAVDRAETADSASVSIAVGASTSPADPQSATPQSIAAQNFSDAENPRNSGTMDFSTTDSIATAVDQSTAADKNESAQSAASALFGEAKTSSQSPSALDSPHQNNANEQLVFGLANDHIPLPANIGNAQPDIPKSSMAAQSAAALAKEKLLPQLHDVQARIVSPIKTSTIETSTIGSSTSQIHASRVGATHSAIKARVSEGKNTSDASKTETSSPTARDAPPAHSAEKAVADIATPTPTASAGITGSTSGAVSAGAHTSNESTPSLINQLQTSATDSPAEAPSIISPQSDPSNLKTATSFQVNAARIFQSGGLLEMRLGLRTEAFGAIQMHTTIAEKQVELALGSERGDLRASLASEFSGLQSSLQQHDLRIDELRPLANSSFQQQSDFSSSSGNQQQRHSHRHNSPGASPYEPAEPEKDEAIVSQVNVLNVRI